MSDQERHRSEQNEPQVEEPSQGAQKEQQSREQARQSATETAPDELEQSEESLAEALREAHDRALRWQAELENARKRFQRDLQEERRYAVLPLIRDLLPAVDNLERALEAAQQQEAAVGLLEGVQMVLTQLYGILEQHHCKRIDPEGALFDPHLHEAIGQQPSDQHAPGTVARVVRVGYQLHDRVIRPSQVLVASRPEVSD